MAGKLWVAVGFTSLFCGFLPVSLIPVAMLLLITVTVLIPTLYSWNYHKKQKNAGTYTARSTSMSKDLKLARKISLPLIGILTVLIGTLMFTGDLDVVYGDTAFTIEASYWNDLTVEYSVIDSVEYRDDFSPGMRTHGFGSARLSLGTFKNEEFGSYTRYSYTGRDDCVVIRSGEKLLAISLQQPEDTRALYEEISARIS